MRKIEKTITGRVVVTSDKPITVVEAYLEATAQTKTSFGELVKLSRHTIRNITNGEDIHRSTADTISRTTGLDSDLIYTSESKQQWTFEVSGRTARVIDDGEPGGRRNRQASIAGAGVHA